MIARLKALVIDVLVYLSIGALILLLVLPQIAAGCGLFHSAGC